MGNIYTIEVQGHHLDIEADSPEEALHAANNWAAPTSAKDVAYDVGASSAAGLGRGTSELFGALGNVRNAVSEGANYLADKAGLSPTAYDRLKTVGGFAAKVYNPALSTVVQNAPTSDQLQHGMESVTGEFHKPTTDYGRYAEAGTAAIPAALMGPEALIPKVAIGLGSGLGGEFLATQFRGTPYETYARMLGQVIGGAGTMTGSKGIEAARNYGAASSAGREIGNVLGTEPIKAGAVRRTAESAQADALTPASVAATQAQLGPETMVMDLGRQMQGRAEAIAQHPGKGQNLVLDAVEGRTGEFGSGARQRIGETLNQELGPSQNVVHVLDNVDQLVQQQARPAYEKVMADFPVINVPSEITSRPAIAQAMKGAESLAKNYGEKLSTSETRTILSGPGYHIADDVNLPVQPSLKFWDYTKKALDQRISGMMRNGVDDLSSAEKADLGGLLSAKQALVQHLDAVTGGQYEAARRIAATKPELHEAMDFGRSIFNSKLLPEEVAAQIQDLSIPAQGMAQIGARRELERILDSVRNDGAKARAFLDTNNNLQKIRQLFGGQAAQAIENRVAAENTFQNATQDIAKNSRTSVRQQLRADTETPSPARIDTTLTGLALKPAKSLYAYALQHGMENTRTGIGQILTAKDQSIAPIVEQLLGYNAKRTSNASTPISNQASALIRVLLTPQGNRNGQ